MKISDYVIRCWISLTSNIMSCSPIDEFKSILPTFFLLRSAQFEVPSVLSSPLLSYFQLHIINSFNLF